MSDKGKGNDRGSDRSSDNRRIAGVNESTGKGIVINRDHFGGARPVNDSVPPPPPPKKGK